MCSYTVVTVDVDETEREKNMNYREAIIRLANKINDEAILSRVYKILLRAYNAQ